MPLTTNATCVVIGGCSEVDSVRCPSRRCRSTKWNSGTAIKRQAVVGSKPASDPAVSGHHPRCGCTLCAASRAS